MQKMHLYLFRLSISVDVTKARLKEFFWRLLNPSAPVQLDDVMKVARRIEQAFTQRQLKGEVAQVIPQEFEIIYAPKLIKGMTQYDINETLPLIVATLQVEQWQVRPVQLPHPGCTHCIAVMF